jgi:hypothetical protein
MREGWKRKASLLRRDRLRKPIINVELINTKRGLAAQPSINNDNCFAKVAGEALPDPQGHAQIKIIVILFLISVFFPSIFYTEHCPS